MVRGCSSSMKNNPGTIPNIVYKQNSSNIPFNKRNFPAYYPPHMLWYFYGPVPKYPSPSFPLAIGSLWLSWYRLHDIFYLLPPHLHSDSYVSQLSVIMAKYRRQFTYFCSQFQKSHTYTYTFTVEVNPFTYNMIGVRPVCFWFHTQVHPCWKRQ